MKNRNEGVFDFLKKDKTQTAEQFFEIDRMGSKGAKGLILTMLDNMTPDTNIEYKGLGREQADAVSYVQDYIKTSFLGDIDSRPTRLDNENADFAEYMDSTEWGENINFGSLLQATKELYEHIGEFFDEKLSGEETESKQATILTLGVNTIPAVLLFYCLKYLRKSLAKMKKRYDNKRTTKPMSENILEFKYTAKEGDYLEKVAKQFNTTVRELIRLNPKLAKNPDKILVGTEIEVPGTAPPPTFDDDEISQESYEDKIINFFGHYVAAQVLPGNKGAKRTAETLANELSGEYQQGKMSEAEGKQFFSGYTILKQLSYSLWGKLGTQSSIERYLLNNEVRPIKVKGYTVTQSDYEFFADAWRKVAINDYGFRGNEQLLTGKPGPQVAMREDTSATRALHEYIMQNSPQQPKDVSIIEIIADEVNKALNDLPEIGLASEVLNEDELKDLFSPLAKQIVANVHNQIGQNIKNLVEMEVDSATVAALLNGEEIKPEIRAALQQALNDEVKDGTLSA